jgi:ATP-dependent DNA helicase RecQ
MINYADNTQRCRSRLLVEYFNEFGAEDCGICDVCLNQVKGDLSGDVAKQIEVKIQELLSQQNRHVVDLVKAMPEFNSEKISTIIRYLLDNDKLHYDNEHRLVWTIKSA